MGGRRRGDAVHISIAGARACELRLLGGFEIRTHGRLVKAIHSCERLFAYLALSTRALPRAYIAATLWPDTTDEKASANLRTALWRARQPRPSAVVVDNSHVSLSPHVWVDVRYVDEVARRCRSTGELPGCDLLEHVRGELLPGFWDSWLTFERERLRQEMIHLCDGMSRNALARNDTHGAVLAALRALECDPLHEPSTVRLIEAYLAEDNRVDALRTFRSYSARLAEELRIQPGPALRALIANCHSSS